MPSLKVLQNQTLDLHQTWFRSLLLWLLCDSGFSTLYIGCKCYNRNGLDYYLELNVSKKGMNVVYLMLTFDR